MGVFNLQQVTDLIPLEERIQTACFVQNGPVQEERNDKTSHQPVLPLQ